MATVRITQDLTSDILFKAGHLFGDRLTAAQKNIPDTEAIAPFVYDATFGLYKEAIEGLPNNTIPAQGRAAIAAWGKFENLDLLVRFPTAKPMFDCHEGHRYSHYFTADIPNYGNATVRIKTEPPSEVVDFLGRYKAAVNVVEGLKQERAQFIGAIRALLNSHSTLSPCLKKSPALWDLLPEHTKEKHKEKVVRDKPEPKPEREVDLDCITKVIATNKLLGGK